MHISRLRIVILEPLSLSVRTMCLEFPMQHSRHHRSGLLCTSPNQPANPKQHTPAQSSTAQYKREALPATNSIASFKCLIIYRRKLLVQVDYRH